MCIRYTPTFCFPSTGLFVNTRGKVKNFPPSWGHDCATGKASRLDGSILFLKTGPLDCFLGFMERMRLMVERWPQIFLGDGGMSASEKCASSAPTRPGSRPNAHFTRCSVPRMLMTRGKGEPLT